MHSSNQFCDLISTTHSSFFPTLPSLSLSPTHTCSKLLFVSVLCMSVECISEGEGAGSALTQLPYPWQLAFPMLNVLPPPTTPLDLYLPTPELSR